MSGRQRIGLIVAALVILVVAFLLLRPSAEDPETTAETPTTTPTAIATPTATAGETASPEPTPTPTPTPRPTVDPGPLLTGEEVVEIRADKGDMVRFQVEAPEDEEVHIHGYDIARDVKAGEVENFRFKATIDGIFEIEFEESGTQIGELRVDP